MSARRDFLDRTGGTPDSQEPEPSVGDSSHTESLQDTNEAMDFQQYMLMGTTFNNNNNTTEQARGQDNHARAQWPSLYYPEPLTHDYMTRSTANYPSAPRQLQGGSFAPNRAETMFAAALAVATGSYQKSPPPSRSPAALANTDREQSQNTAQTNAATTPVSWQHLSTQDFDYLSAAHELHGVPQLRGPAPVNVNSPGVQFHNEMGTANHNETAAQAPRENIPATQAPQGQNSRMGDRVHPGYLSDILERNVPTNLRHELSSFSNSRYPPFYPFNQYEHPAAASTGFRAAVDRHGQDMTASIGSTSTARPQAMNQEPAMPTFGSFVAEPSPLELPPSTHWRTDPYHGSRTTAHRRGNVMLQQQRVRRQAGWEVEQMVQRSVAMPGLYQDSSLRESGLFFGLSLGQTPAAELEHYMVLKAADPAHDRDCPICHEAYDDDEHAAIKLQMTPCDHVFGRGCLQEWVNSGMENAHRCPTCRQSLSGALAAPAHPSIGATGMTPQLFPPSRTPSVATPAPTNHTGNGPGTSSVRSPRQNHTLRSTAPTRSQRGWDQARQARRQTRLDQMVTNAEQQQHREALLLRRMQNHSSLEASHTQPARQRLQRVTGNMASASRVNEPIHTQRVTQLPNVTATPPPGQLGATVAEVPQEMAHQQYMRMLRRMRQEQMMENHARDTRYRYI